MSLYIITTKMEQLKHFYNNKRLFKCDKNMFDSNVQDVLTKLFSCDAVDKTQLYIWDRHIITKCIICSQIVSNDIMKLFETSFIICSGCCETCIDKNMYVEFCPNTINNIGSFLYSYDEVVGTYVRFVDFYKYNMWSVSHHFVDNSHKLIHRFYHTTTIIFLMHMFDTNELNLDVTMYILKFIY